MDSEYWYERIFNKWNVIKIYCTQLYCAFQIKQAVNCLELYEEFLITFSLGRKCKHSHVPDYIRLKLVGILIFLEESRNNGGEKWSWNTLVFCYFASRIPVTQLWLYDLDYSNIFTKLWSATLIKFTKTEHSTQ